MYALNIEKDTGRILSTTYSEYASEDMILVDRLPDETDLPEGVEVPLIDITDFLWEDNYIYSPLPKLQSIKKPTDLDYIKAQVAYTALMTNTALPTE